MLRKQNKLLVSEINKLKTRARRVYVLIDDLKDDKIFWGQVSDILNDMMCKPMKSILEEEVK